MSTPLSGGHRELEICAETLQACIAAEEGGADRIELCAALGEGGVTPSVGLIREALAAVRTPVHVLIRPRVGNFVYTDAEFRAMCRDADEAVAAGVAGIVIGVVTPNGDVDCARVATLVRRGAGRAVTFHRAFDRLRDRAHSLEELIEVGCARVLTSGGLPTVSEGFDSLIATAKQASGRIRIAAGGGITLENASRFAAVEGLDVHASLRSTAPRSSETEDPLWADAGGSVSVDAIRALAAVVHGTVATQS